MQTPMFIVISIPNSCDTQMATEAIRLLTDNPRIALAVARKAQKEREAVFVSQIRVYRLEPGQEYTLRDYTDREKGNPNLVFLSWRNPVNREWLEKFHHGFADLPPFHLIDSEKASRASSGKLRVVTSIDTRLYQVGNEVGAMEEALALKATVPSDQSTYIWDDQGSEVEGCLTTLVGSVVPATIEMPGSIQGRE
jgi:hypothetical protein